jgi:hypothetical protein
MIRWYNETGGITLLHIALWLVVEEGRSQIGPSNTVISQKLSRTALCGNVYRADAIAFSTCLSDVLLTLLVHIYDGSSQHACSRDSALPARLVR